MPAEKAKRPSFTEELAEFWGNLPDKGVFFGLLAAWLALFHFLGNSTFGYRDTPSLISWLLIGYNFPKLDADDSHGFFIPFIVIGLLWWKKDELMTVPKRAWWPGLLMIAAMLLLHLFGYLVQQPRVSIAAMFGGVYCLMGLVWGPRWLAATFFPMLLLCFCMPVASISEVITFPLRMLVTKLSVGISNGVLGIDVLREGSHIFNAKRTFQYDVAPACSGIRSLITLLALNTIYAFMVFKPWWKRLIVVGLAFPLAVAGNTLRLIGVILTAEVFGHDAGAKVEQNLGFLTFLVAIAGLLAAGYILRDRVAPKPVQLEPKPA